VSHRLFFGSMILVAMTLGLTPSAGAQEREEVKASTAAGSAQPDADDGWLSRLSGGMGFDFTNAYFFRGILQERDGFIAQPWGELNYRIFEDEEGPIREISIGGGVWASFQTEDTGASDNPRSLYEVDWYPSLSIVFPEGISLTTIYYFYTSPNDAFSTAQELNFNLGWDDSEVLGRFAMSPYVNLAVETKRTAFGPNKGVGLQLGVEPTLYEVPIEDYPITFTVPVEVGLSLHQYYERASGNGSPFGYVNFGLSASMPLSFVPEALGSWSAGVTGRGYYLSNTLARANSSDHMYPVVNGGLSVEF